MYDKKLIFELVFIIACIVGVCWGVYSYGNYRDARARAECVQKDLVEISQKNDKKDAILQKIYKKSAPERRKALEKWVVK